MIRAGRRAALLTCFLFIAFPIGSAQSAPRRGSSPADPSQLAEHRPDELIVRFKRNARASDRAAIRGLARGHLLRNLGRFRSEHLRIEGVSVPDAIERLRRHPLVEYVEPNYIVHALAVPNDPLFAQMYNLRNVGQTGGTAGADIRATLAWDVFTGDPNLLIGVIDSGVDYRHPDLSANIWTNPGEIPGNHVDDDHNGYVDDVHGYDFANGDGDPMDDLSHGTHVAGIIAAAGNNGLGIAGVCWRARIVAIKFIDAEGGGTHAGALAAMEYAMAVGVRVTNNSWGGGGYTQALLDAINAAGEAGQIFVAAAGNSSNDNDVNPTYPASLESPYIVAVASTDHKDQLSIFQGLGNPRSNYGLTSVDLAAPGSDILSTIPIPGIGFQKFSGTSMATPHVTGAMALVLGRFPGMAALQAKDQVLQGVDPLPSLAGKVATGGRLNLFKALQVRETVPPGAIGDLAAAHPGSNTMELTWTATGDDGATGQATHYEIRYSTGPITEENFGGLPPASSPAPKPSGSAESAEVEGLAFNTSYNFAIRALDEYGNPGPISNVATGATLGIPDVTVTPASLSQALLTGATATQSLTVSNDGQGTLDFTVPDVASTWLEVSPRSGRIIAGQQMRLDVSFDAFGLEAGRHDTLVRILSNDPDEPSLAIPVELQVTGGPDLVVSPVRLDFDTVFVGWPAKLTLTLSNPGTEELIVSAITSADPAVTTAPAAFTLAPRGTRPVEVTYAPTGPGTLESALTIASNDPDGPSREVPLRGSAVPPPAVSVDPESLSATIVAPGTATQTLTIGNVGGSPLVWSLAVAPPPPVSQSPSQAQATGPRPTTWGSDPRFAAAATPAIPVNADPLATLPVVVTDPAGDGPPVDIAELRGGGAGMLQIELNLATPLVPSNFGGFLSLDVDRNRFTGRPPSFGAPGQNIGADYEVLLFNLPSGTVQLFALTPFPRFVGSFAVTIGPGSLRFAIPLGYLGRDDGVMDVTGVIGTTQGPTDWFPDSGHGTIPGTNWLTVTPSEGVVERGQSAVVTVTYDAELLVKGEYPAVLGLNSNDPDNARLDIPVRLTTIGFPELTVTPPSLDFGSLIVGLSRWLDMRLSNDGRAPLIVTPGAVSGPGFFFAEMNVGIYLAPGDSAKLSIRFAPTAPCSPCVGQLTLRSNDGDEDPTVVNLTGTGLPAPDIAVSPASLHAGLETNETVTRTLRIDNQGAGPLEWSIASVLPPEVPPVNPGTPDAIPLVVKDPAGDATNFDIIAMRGITVSGLLLVQLDMATYLFPGSGFLSLDVDRNPATGAPPSQGLYTHDIGGEYEVRLSNLPETVELFTSTGQFVGSFAATSGSRWVGFSIPLSQLGDDDGAIDVTGVIGAASGPLDWFPDRGHGTIRGEVNWLSIDPREGTIPPAGSALVEVRFDATSLDGDDYFRDLVVSSNDPDEPATVVPAQLHVAGVPDIQVERLVSSSKDFASTGARTTHDLVVPEPLPAGGVFELVADGNFPHEGYFATLSAENVTIGSVLGAGFVAVCREARGKFAVSGGTLAALAADGVVHAAVQNSPDVGSSCPQNRHTVRLQYPMRGGTLDFGQIYVGQCAVDSVLIVSRGSDTLRVTSVDLSDATLSASPTRFGVATDDSRGVVLTWCPTASGRYEGSITIHSDDPDAPATTVRVRGTGVVPPGIVVSPQYLVSDLSIPGSAVRMVNIRNDGGTDLDFAARIASAPAAGESGAGNAPSTFGFLSGGPDQFGHRWVDSTEPGGPAFEWVDIARTENRLPLTGQDAISAPIPLNMSFPFYGSTYSTAYVTTNGFVAFTSCCTPPGNLRLPSAGAPPGMIAPFWDALTFTGFTIYAQSDGERFIVSWLGARHRGTPGGPYTFQAILHRDGRIKFQYQSMTPTISEATVGIQNAARNDGLTVAHNASYVRNGLAVLIATGGRFVGVQPTVGTVPPGGSLDLRVDLSTVFTTPGIQVDTVTISTNVPSRPMVSVPVVINVGLQTDIAASPSPLDFGTVFIGGSSEATVRVRNMGLGVLDVTGATVAGSGFSLVGGGIPAVLGPGQEVALAVRFAPASACASCTGSLSISSNDPDENPLTVPLSAIGAHPPDIAVDLDMLRTAGATTLGVLALTQTKSLLVRNTGSSDLEFSTSTAPAGAGPITHPAAGPVRSAARSDRGGEPAIDRAGPGFEPALGLPWLSANPSSGTVSPGSSMALDVVFDATGLPDGDHEGKLVIHTNDPDEAAVEVPCAFHVGVLPATLRVDPHSLMPRSQGRWISADVEPGGLDPRAIALATLRLQRAVPVDTTGPISYGDHDHDGLLEARYKFDRAELFRHLEVAESVTVEVAGEVPDVTWFQGFDVVKRAPPNPHDVRTSEARGDVPREFGLRLHGPSPAPGAVGLELALPRRAAVDLRIYDVQGRLVRVLERGDVDPGWHRMTWNGREHSGAPAAAGVYIARMAAAGREFRQRFVLLR